MKTIFIKNTKKTFFLLATATFVVTIVSLSNVYANSKKVKIEKNSLNVAKETISFVPSKNKKVILKERFDVVLNPRLSFSPKTFGLNPAFIKTKNGYSSCSPYKYSKKFKKVIYNCEAFSKKFKLGVDFSGNYKAIFNDNTKDVFGVIISS